MINISNQKKLKNKWWIVLLVLGFLVWVIYHILTLSYSPLPWFDEVFFADIADSVYESGKMYLQMSLHPEHYKQEFLLYGPVYFHIQAFLIGIFDLQIEVIRMLNLLSGIAIIFLFFWLARKLNLTTIASILIIILIATDTIFNSNMHSGRMDLFCVLLFYLALFLYIFKRKTYLIPLYGLLFVASFLTTPRVGFYFIGLVFLFAYELINRKDPICSIITSYFILAVTFMLPLLLWIHLKFSSLEEYIRYLLNTNEFQSYIGFNLMPSKHQIPVILSCFLLLTIVLIKRRFQLIDLLFGIIILLHLLFIKERGPYSAMIMPLIYISLLLSSSRLISDDYLKQLIPGIIGLILLINILIFSLKAFLVITEKESRSPLATINVLSRYDINNKSVLAEYKYYYVIKKFKGNFLSYSFNEEILEEKNLEKIDYIMVSESALKNLKSKFPKQYYLETPISSNQTQSIIFTYLNRFGFQIETNYNGYLVELKHK